MSGDVALAKSFLAIPGGIHRHVVTRILRFSLTLVAVASVKLSSLPCVFIMVNFFYILKVSRSDLEQTLRVISSTYLH